MAKEQIEVLGKTISKGDVVKIDDVYDKCYCGFVRQIKNSGEIGLRADLSKPFFFLQTSHYPSEINKIRKLVEEEDA